MLGGARRSSSTVRVPSSIIVASLSQVGSKGSGKTATRGFFLMRRKGAVRSKIEPTECNIRASLWGEGRVVCMGRNQARDIQQ